MREGRVYKVYQVLVTGRWSARKHVVKANLQKNVLRSGERMVNIAEEGKTSRTWFDIIEYFPACTLLKAKLDTGRTHQIRVHTCSTGHPIVGDTKYGNNILNKQMKKQSINRLMLHAWQLGVYLPDGCYIEFEAPFPKDFSSGLENLRNCT